VSTIRQLNVRPLFLSPCTIVEFRAAPVFDLSTACLEIGGQVRNQIRVGRACGLNPFRVFGAAVILRNLGVHSGDDFRVGGIADASRNLQQRKRSLIGLFQPFKFGNVLAGFVQPERENGSLVDMVGMHRAGDVVAGDYRQIISPVTNRFLILGSSTTGGPLAPVAVHGARPTSETLDLEF